MMNSAVMLLERSAARWPDRTAVEYLDETVSYRALREKSLAFGTGLIPFAAQPVVVVLPKTPQALYAFYGALYAGTCYVPIDYQEADGRLAALLSGFPESGVVTDEAGRERLLGLGICAQRLVTAEELTRTEADEKAVGKRVSEVIDTDPIYIMHTSGSTGTPKGVLVTHRGVLEYAQAVAETFHLTEKSILGLQSGFHFDNSVFDLYGSLYAGAKLVIIPEILFKYPDQLMDLMEERGISCIFWVPTAMIAAANTGALEGRSLPALETVVFAGEVMPNKQLNVWRRLLPHCIYANLYGPTEITVDCTCYLVDRAFEDSDPLPIGKPWRGARILLLKEDGTPAEAGEEGEICVLGSGLALGYWNAPEQTEKVFVQNPLNKSYPEKMYRTGDLGSWNDRGEVMFRGRRDSQVKIGGIRLELGEVETAAACVEGVRRACALFEGGEIVLFLETDRELDRRKFNRELRAFVPGYMLPGRVVTMDRLPENKNGKIDRPRLRAEYRA